MLETIRHKIANFIAPEVVERRNHFERLAMTDALTGLANGAAFIKAQPAAEADPQFSFIIFDANNFGRVNKVAGHACGNEILKIFADALSGVSRAFAARVFRIGGDEFVIICRARFAERIRDVVERRAGEVRFDDFTVSISGEIGSNLSAADARLQTRKKQKKELCNEVN